MKRLSKVKGIEVIDEDSQLKVNTDRQNKKSENSRESVKRQNSTYKANSERKQVKKMTRENTDEIVRNESVIFTIGPPSHDFVGRQQSVTVTSTKTDSELRQDVRTKTRENPDAIVRNESATSISIARRFSQSFAGRQQSIKSTKAISERREVTAEHPDAIVRNESSTSIVRRISQSFAGRQPSANSKTIPEITTEHPNAIVRNESSTSIARRFSQAFTGRQQSINSKANSEITAEHPDAMVRNGSSTSIVRRISQAFTTSRKKTWSIPRRRSSSNIPSRAVVRATAMVAVVCGVYLLAWSPFFITITVDTHCPSCHLSHTLDLILLAAFTASAINPVLYGLCCRRFRKAYSMVVTSMCSCCK
jgi:hypothetical protein